MEPLPPLAQVHRDATRLGYIDVRASALPRGMHPRTLLRHLRHIGWQRWMPGLWVPGEDDPPYLVRCRIVLAAYGPEALLTGASALWALGILRAEPDDIELLLPVGRYVRARDGVCVHYTADFRGVRSLTAQGLRIAATARAIADHARHAGIAPLCRLIADAERLRHCTLRQVGVELDRRVRRERVVAEVDLPFYDVRYGVEIDGPPHLRTAQAARDTARDRMLRRDCDWTIDRFWWFELEEDPKRFTREVIARLRGLGSAAVCAVRMTPDAPAGGERRPSAP